MNLGVRLERNQHMMRKPEVKTIEMASSVRYIRNELRMKHMYK